jgi:hypothetical protein
MDRLPRPFVACGVGLLLAAAGCRATRPEVPPGRPYAQDGQQRKAIEFSSDGHPVSGAATANFMPSNLGGSGLASGIGASDGRPDGAALGGPPGAYGPPGTAGTGQPGTGDAATTRASGGSLGTAPPGLPPLEAPPAGSLPAPDPSFPPPKEAQPMPSQTVLPPLDTPGKMGTPDQSPSPN